MFDLESVFEMPPVKQEYVKPLKIIDPKIEEFAHLLQANDHEIKKLVLFKLKDYLKKQEPCPPMDDVIKCEMLPLLVKALMSNE
uniref:Uncharacterized protein n=1 Tax=Panagrolaimus superbus TaxID=310955 RepID=A0A914XYS4_9BILA